MKALRVEEPNIISIIEVDEPELVNSQDILIDVKAAGICGSDVSIYGGKSPVATYPRIIGHEITGIVTRIGKDVMRFKLGDHVIVKQTESCGICYACTHGRENVCKDLKVRGVNIDGGYQEKLIVPEKSAYKISESLDLKTAVMIEPFTIAFQACTRGRLIEDDTLLVYGAGALGTSVIQVAKSFGCKIIAIDIDQEKMEQALQMGADIALNGKDSDIREQILRSSDDYGPTICIDTVCNPRSFEFLLDIIGNAGRLVLMGFDTRPSEIPQFKITAREIDVIGSRLQSGNFEKVIKLFEEKKIDPAPMISHIFPYTEIHKAFDVISTGKFKKIVLDFDY